MTELFKDVLRGYLDQTHTGVTRLAKLSGVPRKTIHHWLSGYVLHPRAREDVLNLAQVLHLDKAQTDRLLRAAGHDPDEISI